MDIEKIFLIPYSTLEGFLMIPLTTLYDYYIDRPKFSEQKNTFEYIVPPLKRGRNNNQPNPLLVNIH